MNFTSTEMNIEQFVQLGIDNLNGVNKRMAAVILRRCCSSSAWVEEMVVNRPYTNFNTVKQAALNCTRDLSPSDWEEGFGGLKDISKQTQTWEDQYFAKFGVPFLLEDGNSVQKSSENSIDTTTIIQNIQLALTNGVLIEEQKEARRKFMKGTIHKLASMLVSLGDKTKPVGFHQSKIESSLLQVDNVPDIDVHPQRASFYNGMRLKGLLEWEYKEKDVDLWGGFNYRRTLPDKPGQCTFSQAEVKKSTPTSTVLKPVAQPVLQRQNFFGGTFR